MAAREAGLEAGEKQRKRVEKALTARTQSIGVDLLARVLYGHLLGHEHYGPLGRAVGSGLRLQSHEPEHAGRVDYPSAMAAGMNLLAQELPNGVFGADESAASIEVPGTKPLNWKCGGMV